MVPTYILHSNCLVYIDIDCVHGFYIHRRRYESYRVISYESYHIISLYITTLHTVYHVNHITWTCVEHNQHVGRLSATRHCNKQLGTACRSWPLMPVPQYTLTLWTSASGPLINDLRHGMRMQYKFLATLNINHGSCRIIHALKVQRGITALSFTVSQPRLWFWFMIQWFMLYDSMISLFYDSWSVCGERPPNMARYLW